MKQEASFAVLPTLGKIWKVKVDIQKIAVFEKLVPIFGGLFQLVGNTDWKRGEDACLYMCDSENLGFYPICF